MRTVLQRFQVTGPIYSTRQPEQKLHAKVEVTAFSRHQAKLLAADAIRQAQGPFMWAAVPFVDIVTPDKLHDS